MKLPPNNNKLLALTSLSALGLAFSASGQIIDAVDFGSNNDGLGGFTQSATVVGESYATLADSVQYVNDGDLTGGGTLNSSFLNDYVLDRSNGKSYNMTGTFVWTEGNPDQNSRFGMYLFGDTATVPDQDELGAIGVIYNSDDGGVGNNTNADDDFSILIGIDQSNIVTEGRVQTLVPNASDLRGELVTISTDFSFFDDGGTDSISIESTLTVGGESTVTSTTVAAAAYTGDYFGFVNRARDTVSLPWTIDYESFTISAVPEPSSFALIAGAMAGLLLVRRRS